MHLSHWIDAVVAFDNAIHMPPEHGMFMLHFDNAKRRGFGRSVKHCECEGVLYQSGHVHLDTESLRDEEGRLLTDFASLQQLLETLDKWGNYTLEWDDAQEDVSYG